MLTGHITGLCVQSRKLRSFSDQLLSLPIDFEQVRFTIAGVGNLEWREATARAGGPNNPNRLWPVAVTGFDELLKRKNAQVKPVQHHHMLQPAYQPKHLTCMQLHENEAQQHTAFGCISSRGSKVHKRKSKAED